jgi:membrane protein DedA with SNARE-associated domain
MSVTKRSPLQSLFRALLPQLALLTLIAVLYFFSLLGVIPSPQQLNNSLVKMFIEYGLPLIALSSFLENLVGFNAYFPGAFTILTGMSLTSGHPEQALLTYCVIYFPSYSANILSYYFGRWGKFKQFEVSPTPPKRIWLWFFITYWHPQLASVTAFSAGIQSIRYKISFFACSFITSLFWSTFWALIIYHYGLVANVSGYFSLLFICYILIWTAKDAWKFFKKHSFA